MTEKSTYTRQKTKVFLVGFWPDYETDFLSDITLEDFDVRIFNPMKEGALISVQKWIPRFIRNKIYESKINELISDNKKDSLFIFQEHRLIMELLLKRNEKFKNAIMFRKTIIPDAERIINYLGRLRKQGCQLWSFDDTDCKKYNLNYYPQLVGYIDNIANEEIKYDFSFVGVDKGRFKILNELSDKLKSMGYSVFMNVRGPTKNDLIPYKQYLKEICGAKCIIDIVMDGQTGITMRPLESFLYKRKLITNNQRLKELKIYDPDNIYLIDDRLDLSGITAFLDKPFSEKVKNNIIECMPSEVINLIANKLQKD